ncbi:hypothetical protein SmJEL517_g04803 [Synchytrium microbalum]|uniref:Abnormal spindle-like microcephaly-associated protein ASH domain-containing protein n=1 Tax=Synchytrium microbalum TaxID=1806994 RepID=A0A507BY01_9FUNG|nr:uncharacterized protein SmJEL517_g04803 [Synchytrium microbalum]TPX31991.1 hypothetical protein SmJEL517_g04803 [Synchytrium microbalum]
MAEPTNEELDLLDSGPQGTNLMFEEPIDENDQQEFEPFPEIQHDVEIDDVELEGPDEEEGHEADYAEQSEIQDQPDDDQAYSVAELEADTLDAISSKPTEAFDESDLFPGWSFPTDKVNTNEPVSVPIELVSTSGTGKAKQLKYSMKRDIAKTADALLEAAADIEAINYDIKCVKVLRQREVRSIPALRNKTSELKQELERLFASASSSARQKDADKITIVTARQKYKASCSEYEKCIDTIADCDSIVERLEGTLGTVQLRMDALQAQNTDLRSLSKVIDASDKIHRDQITREREERATLASQTARPIDARFASKQLISKPSLSESEKQEMEAQRAKAIRERCNAAVTRIKRTKAEMEQQSLLAAKKREDALKKISQEMRQIRKFTKAIEVNSKTSPSSLTLPAPNATANILPNPKTDITTSEQRKMAILQKLMREEAIMNKRRVSSYPAAATKRSQPAPSPLKPALRLSKESILYPTTALGSSCTKSLDIILDVEDHDIRFPWVKTSNRPGQVDDDDQDEVRFEFETPKLVNLEVYEVGTDTWVSMLGVHSYIAVPTEPSSPTSNLALTSPGASETPTTVSPITPEAKPSSAGKDKTVSQDPISPIARPSSGRIVQPWTWLERFPPPFQFYPVNNILKPGHQRHIDVVLSIPTPTTSTISGLPLPLCGGGEDPSSGPNSRIASAAPQSEDGNKPPSAKKKKAPLGKDQLSAATATPALSAIDPLGDPPEVSEQKDWIKRLSVFKESRMTWEIPCRITEAAAPSARLSALIAGMNATATVSKQRLADSPSRKIRPDLLLTTQVHVVRPDIVLFAPTSGVINFGEVPVNETLCKKLTVQVLQPAQPRYRFDKSDGCFGVDSSDNSTDADMWAKPGIIELSLTYQPTFLGTHRAIFGLHTPTTQLLVHLVGVGVSPCVELEPLSITDDAKFIGDAMIGNSCNATVLSLSNTGSVAAKVKLSMAQPAEKREQECQPLVNPAFTLITPSEPTFLAPAKKMDVVVAFEAPTGGCDQDCSAELIVDVWGQKRPYLVKVWGRAWSTSGALQGVESQVVVEETKQPELVGSGETPAETSNPPLPIATTTTSSKTMLVRLPWIQDTSDSTWKIQSKVISILNLKPNEVKLEGQVPSGKKIAPAKPLEYTIEAERPSSPSSPPEKAVFSFDSTSGSVDQGSKKEIIITLRMDGPGSNSNLDALTAAAATKPSRAPTPSKKKGAADKAKVDANSDNAASLQPPTVTFTAPIPCDTKYKIVVRGALGGEPGVIAPDQIWNLHVITEMPAAAVKTERGERLSISNIETAQ